MYLTDKNVIIAIIVITFIGSSIFSYYTTKFIFALYFQKIIDLTRKYNEEVNEIIVKEINKALKSEYKDDQND